MVMFGAATWLRKYFDHRKWLQKAKFETTYWAGKEWGCQIHGDLTILILKEKFG